MPSKFILVVSDLHVGSSYAPWPRNGVVTENNKITRIPPSEDQAYLLGCWSHLWKTVGRIDYLIINGDTIDGENPKEHGTYLTARQSYDQGVAAQHLFELARERVSRLFIVKGTPYHEGNAAQSVNSLADRFKAERWRSGLRTGTRLWLDVRGKIINASHHMTRGWIYPAGGADRTALFNAAATAVGKLPAADIIIRSHLHLKRVLSAYNRKVIFTPAWKLLTPWAERTMEETRAELFSDLGAILIEITSQGRISIDDDSYAYENLQPQVTKAR